MSDDDKSDDYYSAVDHGLNGSNEINRRRIALVALITTALIAYTIPLEPPRIGNSRNDRMQALQYVRSWDDDYAGKILLSSSARLRL
jgi:hypothetical protein